MFELARHFLEQTQYGEILTVNLQQLAHLVSRCLQVGVIFVAEAQRAAVLNGVTVQHRPLIGMLAAFPLNDPISGKPFLDEIAWWVEPEHRRGTTGPKLLWAAEKWARQKGLRLVKMVAPKETNVGRFYERMGYVEVETAYVKRLT